jgi:hypothetical protein
MKQLLLALVTMMGGGAMAAPLSPITGDTLNGIPLAQAMMTMSELGEWRLLSAGQVRLEQVMTRNGGECGVSDLDDSDTCGRFTLFVGANGETSVPVDFALYRLPETLGWSVPKGSKPTNDYGKFSIPLSACEMKKTSKGMGWKGTSYILSITETLKDFPGGAHYVFAADLQKLPGERHDCSN